jgi:hypothetical protein
VFLVKRDKTYLELMTSIERITSVYLSVSGTTGTADCGGEEGVSGEKRLTFPKVIPYTKAFGTALASYTLRDEKTLRGSIRACQAYQPSIH